LLPAEGGADDVAAARLLPRLVAVFFNASREFVVKAVIGSVILANTLDPISAVAALMSYLYISIISIINKLKGQRLNEHNKKEYNFGKKSSLLFSNYNFEKQKA
jgi:hypothetical protein